MATRRRPTATPRRGSPAIAIAMLEDIDKNTVDFQPNFDDRLQEPTVLPSKIPNLLVNGSSGIAVGMATNIPPHNLQRGGQGGGAPDRQSGGDHRRPPQGHQGPRLPHRRLHLRAGGDQGGVRDGPRPDRHARPGPDRGEGVERAVPDRGHRDPLPGQQGESGQGDRRAGRRARRSRGSAGSTTSPTRTACGSSSTSSATPSPTSC